MASTSRTQLASEQTAVYKASQVRPTIFKYTGLEENFSLSPHRRPVTGMRLVCLLTYRTHISMLGRCHTGQWGWHHAHRVLFLTPHAPRSSALGWSRTKLFIPDLEMLSRHHLGPIPRIKIYSSGRNPTKPGSEGKHVLSTLVACQSHLRLIILTPSGQLCFW